MGWCDWCQIQNTPSEKTPFWYVAEMQLSGLALGVVHCRVQHRAQAGDQNDSNDNDDKCIILTLPLDSLDGAYPPPDADAASA